MLLALLLAVLGAYCVLRGLHLALHPPKVLRKPDPQHLAQLERLNVMWDGYARLKGMGADDAADECLRMYRDAAALVLKD